MISPSNFETSMRFSFSISLSEGTRTSMYTQFAIDEGSCRGYSVSQSNRGTSAALNRIIHMYIQYLKVNDNAMLCLQVNPEFLF